MVGVSSRLSCLLDTRAYQGAVCLYQNNSESFVRNMKKLLTNPKIIHMIISAMKLCMVLRSMMSIVSLLLRGLNKEKKLILVLN